MKGLSREKTLLLAGRPFFGCQPHNVPVSPSTRAARVLFFHPHLSNSLETFLSDLGLTSSWEVPTIVLSETSTQLESSPTAISGRAGGHTVRLGP